MVINKLPCGVDRVWHEKIHRNFSWKTHKNGCGQNLSTGHSSARKELRPSSARLLVKLRLSLLKHGDLANYQHLM